MIRSRLFEMLLGVVITLDPAVAAAGAVALLLAAELFVAERPADDDLTRRARLGGSWPEAGSLAELRDVLPGVAAWALDGVDDPAWSARNGYNGFNSPDDPAYGGHMAHWHYGHSLHALCPAEQYFDAHPEYYSLVKGKPAPPNPWGAKGLEWETSSPPPTHNFDETPVVTEPAYNYGK
jgi:hypothetical protein